MIHRALVNLRPGALWTLNGNDLEWSDDPIPTNVQWFSTDVDFPTRGEIEAEVARLQAEDEALEYRRKRFGEYPPLADFADAMYWQSKGDNSKMEAYLAAIDAVKEKYPKG